MNKGSTLVEAVKALYPKGQRIVLVKMDDEQAPPSGTVGTVLFVDDIGSIHVSWENGSRLAVVLGEDLCIKI